MCNRRKARAFQISSILLQVHYDSSTEPNFEAMGEDNVIANMTCVCIVGIEVTKRVNYSRIKGFEL